ncbi:MAG: DNA methylase [Candidatus Levybacteria bacterium RIFCSPLOWO2_01_FULL_37_26]|nr:MAG: DNA methylase [Candidatus Levybacteria bacterium RIFCSPLOWO2_01_FULL_37_26]
MVEEFEVEQSVKKLVELPVNQIICGDALEELKKLPSHSVDLIIADPPYWKVVNEKWDYKWRTENDYIYWCKQWVQELARVIKKTGSFYLFGYFRILAYLIPEIERENFSLRQQIIINKGIKTISGRATKNYKMFPNVTESILFFAYNNQPEIKKFLLERQKEKGLSAKEINDAMEVKSNGGGLWSLYTGENILAQIPTREQWEKLQKILDFKKPYSEVNFVFNAQMGFTDVWDDLDFYKEKRYHPTQKPVRLIERLIIASSNESMIILDPFIGAGSTAIACVNLNRNYIGIDVDEKYVKVSEQRIKEAQNTLSLF